MGSGAAWCSAASPAGTQRSAIHEVRIVSEGNTASLAVWDVPMPVVAGETFQIKVGVKSAPGQKPGESRVEVSNVIGVVVASGKLGDTPWAGTEALHWVALEVPAPAKAERATYIVRCGSTETWFSIVAAAKPEHTLTVHVTEQASKAALDGVEIRLGPFHARTDKAGRAELRVCAGEYCLTLWRTAHISQPQPITIEGDVSIDLAMVHVPEEHPDARWVR
jgi:hypothetical protein